MADSKVSNMKYCLSTFVLILLFLVPMQGQQATQQQLAAQLDSLKHWIEQKDLSELIPHFQSAREQGLAQYPALYVQYLYLFSDVYTQLALGDSASIFVAEALRVSQEHQLEEMICMNLYHKGIVNMQRAQFPEAVPYLDSAANYFMATGNLEKASSCLGKLANTYAAIRNRKEALVTAERAIDLISKTPIRPVHAEVYNDIGGMYGFLNDMPSCTRMLIKAYAVAHELNLLRSLAGITNNLSVVFTYLQQFDRAKRFNQEAIKACETLNLATLKTTALFNRANLLVQLQEIDSARWYLNQVESQKEALSFRALNPYVERVRGDIALQNQELELAENHYLEAKALASQNKDMMAGLGASVGLANYLVEAGKYGAALKQLDELIEQPMLTEIDQKELYGLQARAFQAEGKYKEAMEALSGKQRIQDTILSLERIGIALSTEADFELQVRQGEIERLEFQNQLEKKQNVQNQRTILFLLVLLSLIVALGYYYSRHRRLKLERNLAEVKESLLRMQMNPHFIFNSLNSIQSSFLQADEEKTIHLFGRFSTLMRQVLQNSEETFVPLNKELELLDNYLELEQIRSNHKFAYQLEIGDKIKAHQIEVPTMILQIFVENAIWHGIGLRTEPGNIHIQVVDQEGKPQIRILDDGVGQTYSQAQKTADQKKRQSLGTHLARQRIQQLNRKFRKTIALSVEDRLDRSGTMVTLTL